MLTGSSLTLGDVATVDGGAATVSSRVSDAEFSSKNELGSFNGSIYTAGDRAGTDEIAIRSRDLDLTGSAQIHVVDTLTSLTVSRASSTSPPHRPHAGGRGERPAGRLRLLLVP